MRSTAAAPSARPPERRVRRPPLHVRGLGVDPADDGRNDELLVALHSGTVKRSTDRGAGWTIRSTP